MVFRDCGTENSELIKEEKGFLRGASLKEDLEVSEVR